MSHIYKFFVLDNKINAMLLLTIMAILHRNCSMHRMETSVQVLFFPFLYFKSSTDWENNLYGYRHQQVYSERYPRNLLHWLQSQKEPNRANYQPDPTSPFLNKLSFLYSVTPPHTHTHKPWQLQPYWIYCSLRDQVQHNLLPFQLAQFFCLPSDKFV